MFTPTVTFTIVALVWSVVAAGPPVSGRRECEAAVQQMVGTIAQTIGAQTQIKIERAQCRPGP